MSAPSYTDAKNYLEVLLAQVKREAEKTLKIQKLDYFAIRYAAHEITMCEYWLNRLQRGEV